jgi:two-component system sensor histidine kinase RegB
LVVLVKKACVAAAGGGRVALRVTAGPDAVDFAVSDRGAGMDAETAERACEPFFTTKAPGEGMGLGLFLVRTFVERMRGRMEIDSMPGRGTTVVLRIPSAGKAVDA